MDAFLSRCNQSFGKDWIIVFLRNVESSLYRNDSTFLKSTIIQSGSKIWLRLYIEMIPDFLRKQCFHIKCVLFRQCNQYGINSISVIDASLWIHLQESESLSCQLYWTGWIIIGEFYSKTPQNKIHVWKTIAFSLRNWNGRHQTWKNTDSCPI